MFELRAGRKVLRAAERRTKRGTPAAQYQFIQYALLLGERRIDAVDLLVGEHIRRAAFDPVEPRVVLGLEGLERAHEVVEGGGYVAPLETDLISGEGFRSCSMIYLVDG